MSCIDDEKNIIEFAEVARDFFKKNTRCNSYTAGEIKAGCLFAMRFGLVDDCVLLFKLDDNFQPINFQNCIRR